MALIYREIRELPPLSSSARAILKIAHDDDAEVSEFTEIIEKDPALLARIIGLANSAYFGNRSVTDVNRAVIDVLGLRTAKNVALGVVLGGVFNARQCRAFNLPQFWFVSLLTATLSRDFIINLKLKHLDANDAYLSGMLNELGLMVMTYLYPDESNQVLTCQDDEAQFFAAQMDLLGEDYFNLGAHFLESWQLPEVVLQVMRESSPLNEANPGELAQLISFSRVLARQVYERVLIDFEALEIPDVLAGQQNAIADIFEAATSQFDAFREMAELLS
jgi:HD-like signal output (HDOD) protein